MRRIEGDSDALETQRICKERVEGESGAPQALRESGDRELRDVFRWLGVC